MGDTFRERTKKTSTPSAASRGRRGRTHLVPTGRWHHPTHDGTPTSSHHARVSDLQDTNGGISIILALPSLEVKLEHPLLIIERFPCLNFPDK